MYYNLKNLLTPWRGQKKAMPFAVLFQKFQSILA